MDEWQERLVQNKSTRQIVDQSNRIGIQFLIADLNVALTFLDVAKVTESDETRRRNRENARSAYLTVQRLLPRLSPSEEERGALEAKMTELKDRLFALGYVIDDLETQGGSEP